MPCSPWHTPRAASIIDELFLEENSSSKQPYLLRNKDIAGEQVIVAPDNWGLQLCALLLCQCQLGLHGPNVNSVMCLLFLLILILDLLCHAQPDSQQNGVGLTKSTLSCQAFGWVGHHCCNSIEALRAHHSQRVLKGSAFPSLAPCSVIGAV